MKVHETDFTHVNKFAELATPHEDTKPTIDPSGSGGGGTSPLMRQPGRNPTMGNFGQNWPKKKLLKAAFEKQCGCSQGESRGSPEHACPRGLCSFESPSNSETMPGSSVPREGSSRPTFPGPSGASNSGTTRPKVTTQVNLTDAIKKPSLNVLRKERIKQEPSPAKLLEAMSEKVNPDFLSAINEAWTTGTSKLSAHALKLFRTTSVAPQLCPFKTPTGDKKKPTADPRTWEVISSVVDSGATVPALHPETGFGYEVEESDASRAGVEYDTAGSETLPALGRKRLAVITPEGALRGYQSEVANVSSPLQSVRTLLSNKHCVLFGLGPNEEEHLIINKVSGEVNRMRDDGTNYLQDLLVVLPEHLEDVVAQMNGADPAPPFGRQG